MSCEIIDFQRGAEKHHVPDVTDEPNDRQYIIELEHEVLELQQQVCALHRDLVHARGDHA